MTEEQKKVRKFYKDFLSWKAEAIGTWIGAGVMVMFLLIACAVPAQEVLMALEEETDYITWMILILFGPLAGLLYLRPYTNVTEIVYTNQPTNARIIDKLKYLPIDFKEIRKMKVIYLFKFFAKILPFGMGLQMLTCLASYGEITWLNVGYGVLVAFIWPVVTNLPMVLMETHA